MAANIFDPSIVPPTNDLSTVVQWYNFEAQKFVSQPYCDMSPEVQYDYLLSTIVENIILQSCGDFETVMDRLRKSRGGMNQRNRLRMFEWQIDRTIGIKEYCEQYCRQMVHHARLEKTYMDMVELINDNVFVVMEEGSVVADHH